MISLTRLAQQSSAGVLISEWTRPIWRTVNAGAGVTEIL